MSVKVIYENGEEVGKFNSPKDAIDYYYENKEIDPLNYVNFIFIDAHNNMTATDLIDDYYGTWYDGVTESVMKIRKSMYTITVNYKHGDYERSLEFYPPLDEGYRYQDKYINDNDFWNILISEDEFLQEGIRTYNVVMMLTNRDGEIVKREECWIYHLHRSTVRDTLISDFSLLMYKGTAKSNVEGYTVDVILTDTY